MRVNHIDILSQNSFYASMLFAHFLSGAKNHKVKYELAFLLLPIISNPNARSILCKSNVKSTIATTFLNRTNGVSSIANLDNKIAHFNAMTRAALIIGASDYEMVISEYIYISKPLDYKIEKDGYVKEYQRASYYLGHILSNNHYLDTFIKLGVKIL